MSSFGSRLKDLRNNIGIPQHALAAQLSVKQSAVSGWENDTREPSLDALRNIAHFFGVSLDYLLGLTDDKGRSMTRAAPEDMIEVTPFEREVLLRYRILPPSEQIYICRMLELPHPAARRDSIKQA